MPIIAKASGSNFTPAPAGTHTAVCVDVVDLGVLEVSFGGKNKMQHKIKLVWQIGEDMENGKPFMVSKRYTCSLHEKAALRKDLESWRGRAFTEGELSGFDLESLISVPCMLGVIHAPGKDGGTFANVSSVMKAMKGMVALTPRDYVRVCERPPTDAANGNGNGNGHGEPINFTDITDDDVPF